MPLSDKPRMKEIATLDVRIKVSSPVNQDASTILIMRRDEDGKQFYVRSFEWVEYKGYDMLDVTLCSTNAPISVEAPPKRRSNAKNNV